MSLKTDRINTQILREVSLILQNEVRDRDLRMCTITAVETTNDLSISKWIFSKVLSSTNDNSAWFFLCLLIYSSISSLVGISTILILSSQPTYNIFNKLKIN